MFKLIVLLSVFGLVLSKALPPFMAGKIIGGQKAKQGQFPSIVSLQDARGGGHFCGGAIISERYIISAGHCFYGSDDPADSIAIAGTTDNTKGGVKIEFSAITVHEDFNMFELYNDITLLKTKNAIPFSDDIAPVKLPSDGELPDGTDITALGWGTISYPIQNYPDDLYFVPLKVVGNAKCGNRLDTDIADSQVCVGGVSGKGLCYGDSGSPLIKDNTTYGIVSWGEPCAIGSPDVFTRVSSFTDWIQKNQLKLNGQE